MPQPELHGPAPKPGKHLKVSLFLTRKPEISDEYFHAYWYHNHTALFLHINTFKTLVRKYNQSHYIKDCTSASAELLQLPQLEFDGVAEFWVDSLEDWKKLFSDPEFTQALAGDNALFVKEPLYAAAGYDYLFHEQTETRPKSIVDRIKALFKRIL